MRLRLLTALTLLLHAAPASAEGFDFKPTRYAFLPELTAGQGDPLCRSFLAAVTDAFKGPGYRIDLAAAPWPGADLKWIFPVAEQDQGRFEIHEIPIDIDDGPKARVVALPVDLDQDGKTEILASVSWNFNWQGDWNTLVIYPSRADFEAAVKAGKMTDAIFKRAIDAVPAAGYNSASTDPPISATWEERRVVAVDGGYYALLQGEVFQDDSAFSLWRIHAGKPSEQTCAVKALPDDDDAALSVLQSGPVEAFVKLVAAASGEEGSSGGTLHAQSRLLIDAGRALIRVGARPWVLDQAPVYNSRAAVDAGLDAWSRASLYTYQIRRAWPEYEAAAREDLSAYYQAQFGLAPEAAGRAAADALDILVRAHFVFRADGIPALPDRPYRGLTLALLKGEPRAKIETLLKDGYRIRTRPNMGTDDEDGRGVWGYFTEEPTLFYALENPVNVAVLLRAGADPNVKGNFDKTALMYAAQFDLVDTAKVLLAAGAAVDAATSERGNEALLTRYKRTALIYAAENASAEMIRLLLARGAAATAVDATRRGVLHYLGLNQRLSAADRTALAAELTKLGALP